MMRPVPAPRTTNTHPAAPRPPHGDTRSHFASPQHDQTAGAPTSRASTATPASQPVVLRLCVPGEPSDDVRVEADFANLAPPLAPGELAALHASLDAEGCRDPLLVWRGPRILLDGHNRLRHCRARGIPFRVAEIDCTARHAALAHATRLQLARRNLSPAAEAYLRGARYLAEKRQGVRVDSASGNIDHKTAAQRLAAEFGVGEKTVRRDAQLTRAVDAVTRACGGNARSLLLARSTGLTWGGALALARMPLPQQRAYLCELERTGARPRRRRKGEATTLTLPCEPAALVARLVERLGPEAAAEVHHALGVALAASAAPVS